MLEHHKGLPWRTIAFVVPLALFFHYVQNYDQPYLKEQNLLILTQRL